MMTYAAAQNPQVTLALSSCSSHAASPDLLYTYGKPCRKLPPPPLPAFTHAHTLTPPAPRLPASNAPALASERHEFASMAAAVSQGGGGGGSRSQGGLSRGV
jgi:hypothetical protein